MANTGRHTTGSIPRALQFGVDNWIKHFTKQYGNVGDMLFTKVDPHGKGFYESVSLSGMGEAARKGEGSAIQYDSIDQEFSTKWAIHTWIKAARLTMEAIDDDIINDLLPMYAKGIAQSLVYTKDEQRADVLNNAFTSGETGPDGKVLCATDHPLQAGGTSANRAATDADFSEDALEQLILLADNILLPNGLRSMYNTKYLVVPTALKFDVCRVHKAKYQTNNAENAVMAINQRGDIKDYLVWKRIQDSDAWFVTTDFDDCLVEVTRKAPFRKESVDSQTFDLIISICERYRMLFNDWRGIVGSAGQ